MQKKFAPTEMLKKEEHQSMNCIACSDYSEDISNWLVVTELVEVRLWEGATKNVCKFLTTLNNYGLMI